MHSSIIIKKLTDPSIIANKFNEYFANIGTNLDEPKNAQTARNKYLKDVTTVSFSFSPVSSDDINQVFRSLTPKSSTGLDDLFSKMLKLIQDSLTPIMCVTINQSLINGIFPEKLKYAKVKPLYKKDVATVFTNYRSISLLPAISKIFEKNSPQASL